MILYCRVSWEVSLARCYIVIDLMFVIYWCFSVLKKQGVTLTQMILFVFVVDQYCQKNNHCFCNHLVVRRYVLAIGLGRCLEKADNQCTNQCAHDATTTAVNLLPPRNHGCDGVTTPGAMPAVGWADDKAEKRWCPLPRLTDPQIA